MRRLSRPSRTTKVGFLGIEEDFPPTSARSTREAAFDEDSHPSTAGHQPVDSQESAQEAVESNPTKKNAGGKTEPWNIAKTEPNITEFALPSSKPNRNRIILWHVSNVLIGILCVGCSATQYFAFAELMHELNIHKEDQNLPDQNLPDQNLTDKNYGTSRATNGEITGYFKYLFPYYADNKLITYFRKQNLICYSSYPRVLHIYLLPLLRNFQEAILSKEITNSRDGRYRNALRRWNGILCILPRT